MRELESKLARKGVVPGGEVIRRATTHSLGDRFRFKANGIAAGRFFAKVALGATFFMLEEDGRDGEEWARSSLHAAALRRVLFEGHDPRGPIFDMGFSTKDWTSLARPEERLFLPTYDGRPHEHEVALSPESTGTYIYVNLFGVMGARLRVAEAAHGPVSPEDIDRLADEIAELAAHLDAGEARQLACIRRFDEREGWGRQGALNCAHWLSWRIGVDLGTARQKVRVARALGGLPLIEAAFRRGELSYSKVRAMTRVATKENESTLLDLARCSTGGQLEILCRELGQVVRTQIAPEPESEDDERWVRRRETEDGMVRIQAQLRPEEAAVVMKALEAAVTTMAPGGGSKDGSAEPRESRFTKADALVAVAEAFLARESTTSSVPGRFEVMLHVDAKALGPAVAPRSAELADGTPLPVETARRIACDAPVIEVRDDPDGAPVVGPRTRTIPAALRRALLLRDGGCRFPGCTNRIFVDAHHIRHWADGGETTLGNLVLLCRRHHRLAHELGFRIEPAERAGDVPTFFDPRGRKLEPVPRQLDRITEPFVALVQSHVREGLDIDPETAYPDWDGEPMDHALAVDALLAASKARDPTRTHSSKRVTETAPSG